MGRRFGGGVLLVGAGVSLALGRSDFSPGRLALHRQTRRHVLSLAMGAAGLKWVRWIQQGIHALIILCFQNLVSSG